MAGSYADAISGIESGGKYDLLGPQTKSGDRAYGRYQVMGENIPEWTKQYFGQSLTPDEFLNNPQAQDAVFNGQFGQYVQKYGPEGAAKAWFAGERGMNNPDAKDMLGTSVADYGRKFTTAMGGQPDYSSVSSPALTPGSPAPALPPGINIGGAPAQNNAPAGLLMASASPQQQQAGILGGGGGGSAGGGILASPQMAAPGMPQAVRPRVDMTPLLQFLQARNGPPSWSL